MTSHYKGFRITGLWAFTQVGPDDEEGIIGVQTVTGMMLASDRVRLEDWAVLAQETADATRREVHLARYDVRTDLETYHPTEQGLEQT